MGPVTATGTRVRRRMNFCRYRHWPGGDGEVIVVVFLVLVCA
jgi:hypothetical protein